MALNGNLNQVPLDQIEKAQQAALVALLMTITWKVHELGQEVFQDPIDWLRGLDSEALTPSQGNAAKGRFTRALSRYIDAYTDLTGKALEQAAKIPIGTLALIHERDVVKSGILDIEERGPSGDPFLSDLWEQILRETITARRHADGGNLSGRIWRLENSGQIKIDETLIAALGGGLSPWQTAELMEAYLGYGADCPRWLRARLFALRKKDIAAGDRQGLLTGDLCGSGGLSYNALRLARTEASAVADAMTRAIYNRIPWITAEKINLSPEHPETDICDDAATGGDLEDGAYTKGNAPILPLHPHCLCYRTAVIDYAMFNRRMAAYKANPNAWPAMEAYKQGIGGSLAASLMGHVLTGVMATYLFGAPDDLEAPLE